ncbi:hypothetical protein ACFQO7_11920 [Catellatospora aurea]|uniref:Uncharacterized protein n=1 Tax=Catellatospora aurea TaxID=1337874 RepID=A0ABW2GUS7_9ACTN
MRLTPSCDDPVSEALADARPLPRHPQDDAGLGVEDLRWIVSVAEVESVDEPEWNTVVGLDDTVSSYADGLADELADQPGIDAAHHVDREAVLVRSVLSLPDVHAAAIRALLAINRSPRTPRDRRLPPAAMNALADGVAAILAGRGFTGRLGGPDAHGTLFYRVLPADRLAQTVELRDGFDAGEHGEGTLIVTVGVVEIGTADPAEAVSSGAGLRDVLSRERVLSVSYDAVPATVDGVANVLTGRAFAMLESTRTRSGVVDRWVGGLPWSVPDRLFWEAADVAARWGFRGHARDLLKHGPRRSPQARAVAARHGLDG